MAGDFVMVQCATPRKPEVLRIATDLNIDPAHAFGLCVIAWMWFDEQTEDGRAVGATDAMLDAVVCRAGFSDALRNVGWLHVRDGALVVPNFDRLMGESAKKRAKNTVRQQQHRRNAAVTKTSRNERDKSATKEEKRREEKSNKPPTPFVPPNVDQVKAYCLERKNAVDAQRFIDHYESNGWKVGKAAMRDWQAAVRTWEKNNFAATGPSQPHRPQVATAEDLKNYNPNGL